MPKGIYIRTKEHKKKMSEYNKKIGRKPPSRKGKKHTEKSKIKMSLIQKDKKASETTKRRMSLSHKGLNTWMKGRKLSEVTKKKIGEAEKGAKNSSWKGGITPFTERIRASSKYQEWRQQCFIRDNFTCQKCGQIGGKLEVHHKRLFSVLVQEAKEYMPLINFYDACMLYIPLWDILNGITFCKKCHPKYDKKSHYCEGG